MVKSMRGSHMTIEREVHDGSTGEDELTALLKRAVVQGTVIKGEGVRVVIGDLQKVK